MGTLARLRLVKIRTMARPNSPGMPPKRTKMVRLGIKTTFKLSWALYYEYNPINVLKVIKFLSIYLPNSSLQEKWIHRMGRMTVDR